VRLLALFILAMALVVGSIAAGYWLGLAAIEMDLERAEEVEAEALAKVADRTVEQLALKIFAHNMGMLWATMVPLFGALASLVSGVATGYAAAERALAFELLYGIDPELLFVRWMTFPGALLELSIYAMALVLNFELTGRLWRREVERGFLAKYVAAFLALTGLMAVSAYLEATVILAYV